jgi:asparagine synthase (glutamine-hydrolysing)
MIKAMHERGPDDTGVFEADGVVLGHTRLAIIDRSPGGHQPMGNAEKSIWIAYNGETYNYREERERLIQKGHVFTTSSDTEVVLRLYEEYGIEFLSHLRGIFALAIYDRRPRHPRLVLARDPFGIKPLLYASRKGSLIFASELKALLASGLIERQLDPISLRLLLAQGSVPQPRSIVSGVEMLLPGHVLVHEGGSTSVRQYWRIGRDRVPSLRSQPYQEQVRAIRKLLEETVAMQMVSDAPIGAFLSGGIDSTITAALMARIGGSRLKTFSVGFGTEGASLDETDDALRVARFIGSDHSKVFVTGEEVRDRLSHFTHALDQPSVNGINSYFVSLAAQRSVTVALSGTGGDELFAGYPWYSEMARFAVLDQKAGIASRLRTALGMTTRIGLFDGLLYTPAGKVLDRLRSFGGFVPHYRRQYQIFGQSGAACTLSREWVTRGTETLVHESFDSSGDELPDGSPVERVTALCLRGYTQNQLLRDIDAVSMSHSLEVRVPFLDHCMVDAALSLPDNTKIGEVILKGGRARGTYRDTGMKRILIDAGRDLLPPDMDAQEKRGFSMPLAAWLRGPLKDVLTDGLSGASVQRRGIFNPKEVQRYVQGFLDGRSSWVFPWLLLVTELWCREVLEGNS